MRFSVVVPTHQRRELVVAAVRALGAQELDLPFEVLVVVDGSTDGSAAALRALAPPFPLTVLEQPNRGAAAARNRGAAAARGEILLFLDDDMEAHPRLLAEHDRSHRAGAEVVLGHIPLHPASPAGFLSAAVGRWAEERARSLSQPDVRWTSYELLTGQLSVRREIFAALGGFDRRFTRGGAYGDEDLDFGQRLLQGGYAIAFNPDAISHQSYVVSPREHLRQWRQTGAADVDFARKHPDEGGALFVRRGAGTRPFRLLWRAVVEVPGLGALLSALLRRPLLALAERIRPGRLAFRTFRWLRSLEYWRGVRAGGGIPRPRPLRVLAYHAVADLAGDRLLAPYGVPPALLRRQLAALRRAGYRFVAPGELLRLLEARGGVPRRPLLLTFDDCYADLLEAALPLLEEQGAPAAAFAVSGRLGETNRWDEGAGAQPLRLLDARGLHALAERGVEIGAHSRTHRRLVRLPDAELPCEVGGSIEDLAALGLPRPRLFAFPYGEEDERLRRAAAGAGVRAAFTIQPGLVRPGQDPLRLPRVEVLRRDSPWRLRLKLAWAGRPGLRRPA